MTQSDKNVDSGTLTTGAKRTVVILLVTIAVLAVIGAVVAPAPNIGFKDAAAVILVVTATATGIERMIEGLWLLVGSRTGTAWPFQFFIDRLNQLSKDMDSGLQPYQKQASALIARAVAVGDWTQTQIDDAGADLERLKSLTSDLSAVAQHHSKLKIAVAAAAEHISYIEAKYTVLMEAKATKSRTERELQVQAAATNETNALLAQGKTQEEAETAAAVVAAKRRADLALQAAIEQRVADELGKLWAAAPHSTVPEAKRAEIRAQSVTALTKRADEAAAQVDPSLSGTAKALAEQEARARAMAAVTETDPVYSIGHAFGVAREALGGAMNMVTSFRDNPGRRLLSLLAGMVVGLIAAIALGFDIFSAILGIGQIALPPDVAASTNGALSSLKWGVVATGIVIGLGAEPAHQVIKILQETKKRRELLNRPSMVATETAVDDGDGESGGARSVEVWQPGAVSRGGLPAPAMTQTTTRGPRFIRFY